MAIDTGIYANLLRPPKSVAEYDQEAQASQLNALQLQQGRMKQDEYQRGIADQNALRDATRGFGADTTANYNALLRTGNMKAAQDYLKSNTDLAKTRGEMGKDAAQTAKYNGEVMDATLQRYRGALDTIADPQSAAQWLQAQYSDPVIGGFMATHGPFEQAVSKIPTDAQGFQQWRMQAAMGMEKFIADQRVQSQQAETKRSNVTRETETARSHRVNEGIAGANLGLSRERLNSDKADKTKAPSGYRFTADGALEAIPGGPAAVKASSGEIAKVTDAKDVISLLDQAEPLLDAATNSYVGKAIDQGARVFGKSTPGAQSAAELRALEGALIAKMPKMSGPQSDKDVLLYKQMAGQIGDDTVPADTKRAAMKTIRAINERHAGGAPKAAPAAAPGAFDAEKERRYQEWKAKQK